MNCPKCGRELADHKFWNEEEAAEYHAAMKAKRTYVFDYDKIRNCETCGRLPSDHPCACVYCGTMYCTDHVDPRNHACPEMPRQLRPQRAPFLPDLRDRLGSVIGPAIRIAAILFGIWIILTGADIAWGNRTGHHVTFPFAGFIVSFIGLAIIVVALRYPRL